MILKNSKNKTSICYKMKWRIRYLNFRNQVHVEDFWNLEISFKQISFLINLTLNYFFYWYYLMDNLMDKMDNELFLTFWHWKYGMIKGQSFHKQKSFNYVYCLYICYKIDVLRHKLDNIVKESNFSTRCFVKYKYKL